MFRCRLFCMMLRGILGILIGLMVDLCGCVGKVVYLNVLGFDRRRFAILLG